MEQMLAIHLDFEIDKLTNSIENSISGEVFDTMVSQLSVKETAQIQKDDWVFDWKSELKKPERQVFKLTTVNNEKIIHGLLSITIKQDHVFMDLIESAKFNKGKHKLYRGVAGNLVAFSCKTAFELGYEGVVSFVAKTALINHYEQTLGAKLFGGNRMFVDTKEAYQLTKKYFKAFEL